MTPWDAATGRSRSPRACDRCLARTWLIGALAGHLDQARARIEELLALRDDELVAAVGGRHAAGLYRQLRDFDACRARERAAAAGLGQVCRCDDAYPIRLRALGGAPAVLHVAGGVDRFLALVEADPVGIVGARRPSAYGTDVAHALGRGLACAGVTVVSGMALGIDSAAHDGALAVEGPTIAVLPGSPERPYPSSGRVRHRRIVATGAAVSELPPGVTIRRWMFPARNRIIAGLSTMTVVVEATRRSGALLTAAFARGLGRPVGAVPGRITSPVAAGPNGLLRRGALVVRGAQDVLDELFGAGMRIAEADRRAPPRPELRALLSAIDQGDDTAGAIARAGVAPGEVMAALAELELGGHIRREPGGRFTVVP